MKPPEGARVVRLDATGADVESAGAIAAQIPDASTLPSRAAIVVPQAATKRGGALRRWLGDRSVAVPRHVRCAALLARGYVDLGADDAQAWGFAP
jgi:hypothetical protein